MADKNTNINRKNQDSTPEYHETPRVRSPEGEAESVDGLTPDKGALVIGKDGEKWMTLMPEAGDTGKSLIADPSKTEGLGWAVSKSLVSARDTTPGFLSEKIVDSVGITSRIARPGCNEELQIELGPHFLALAATGWYSGAALSAGVTPGTFDVSEGDGLYVDSTTAFPTVSAQSIPITARTNVVITDILTQPVTYVLVDKDDVILQQSAFPTPSERRGALFLGVVVHTDNATVNAINNLPAVAYGISAQLQDLMEGLGFFNVADNVISHTGSANLMFNKSAGIAFKSGANAHTDPNSPHHLPLAGLAPASFRYRTLLSVEASDITVLDPSTWDDGGTVTTVGGGPNRTTIQRVFVFPSNQIRIQRGQFIYDTFAEAVNAVGHEPFQVEPNIGENGLQLASIVLKHGATDLTDDSEALIFVSSRFGEQGSVGSSVVSNMQNVYDNSVQPVIVLDGPGTFKILDSVAGIGTDLFAILDNTEVTKYFSVDAAGISVAGSIAVTGTVDGRDIDGDGTVQDEHLDGTTENHAQYPLLTGTRPFTGTQGGVTPAIDSDLATKGYVDLTVGATQTVTVTAKVDEAGGISVGEAVFIAGATGGFPQVSLADNSILSSASVLAVAAETKTDGQSILVVTSGLLENFDTSSFSEGDVVYLGVAGAITATHPTGTNAVQRLGRAVKINASTGSMIVNLNPLTVIDDLDGTVRHQLVNQNVGTSSAAAYTIVNDADHRASISLTGENFPSFEEVLGIYHEGYGNIRYHLDGNHDHEWITDVTDSHNFSATVKMTLNAAGDLSLVGDLTLGAGTDVGEFSIDGTLAGDSDDAVPTEQAVKTYVDTGSGGSLIQGEYSYKSDVTDTDPLSGNVKFDNVTLASVTEVYISDTTTLGTDAEAILDQLATGDQIYFQEKSDSANLLRVEISGAVTENAGWRKIPVTVEASAGSLSNNDKMFVVLIFGAGGGGGAVDSVFTRTGAVVAVAGDYSADEVTFTPAGDIGATDVQAAVVEVRDETDTKLALHSLADGTRDFTGVVKGVTPVVGADLSTMAYVDGEIDTVNARIPQTMMGQRAGAVPNAATRRMILAQLFNADGVIALPEGDTITVLAVNGSFMNDTSETTGTWTVGAGISAFNHDGTSVTSYEATVATPSATASLAKFEIYEVGSYKAPLVTHENTSGATEYLNVYIENSSADSKVIPATSPYQWVSVTYVIETL